jgi:hypothetical protein
VQTNQISFYEGSELKAVLAPYDEWPDLDLNQAIEGWKVWNSPAHQNDRSYAKSFGAVLFKSQK